MSSSPDQTRDYSRIDRYFTPDSTKTDPQLLGSRCTDCGFVEFPKRDRCPACLEPMTDHPLSRTGTLHSYSTLRFGPPQFNPPYTIGCVDLPEDVRIFSRLQADIDYSVGQEMQVQIAPVIETPERVELGYIFSPGEA